eukprot:3846516-Rhodomonas_salina.4
MMPPSGLAGEYGSNGVSDGGSELKLNTRNREKQRSHHSLSATAASAKPAAAAQALVGGYPGRVRPPPHRSTLRP